MSLLMQPHSVSPAAAELYREHSVFLHQTWRQYSGKHMPIWQRGRTEEDTGDSRWAASHVKIPPSVVNGLTACVLSPCTCLQSTSVLLVLALISQPGRLTADPRKSDYWLGWTGHDGIASQTWITVKLGRPYGSLQRFVSGL